MDFVAWEVLLVGILIVLSLLPKAALGHLDVFDCLLVGVGLQMLDVGELDDLSGVVLLALLAAPANHYSAG
jgi:hypothetical protein